MLGEPPSGDKFRDRKQFEQFVDLSRRSQVPMDFISAQQHVTRTVAPHIFVEGNIPIDYQAIALPLFERQFPTPHTAFYALMYGGTIGRIKYWEHFKNGTAHVIDTHNGRVQEYQALLLRLAKRYECSIDEVPSKTASSPLVSEGIAYHESLVAEHKPLVKQITEADSELRKLAELSTRVLIMQEQGWLLPLTPIQKTMLQLIGFDPESLQTGTPPTLEELQEIRTYIEDYFSDDEKKARISKIAAQE